MNIATLLVTAGVAATMAGPARALPLPLAGSQDACAPPGLPAPRLAVHPEMGGGEPALLFQAGEDLAHGAAWLLLEGRGGHKLPAGFCTGGLRGRLAGPVLLDADGACEWNLPPSAWSYGASLRVAAWGPGAPSSMGVVSNTVALPLQTPRGAEELGKGQVVVTEFMKDPSFVSDATGEWIELHNPTSQPIDVEGWSLSDHGSDFTILDNSGLGIVIQPGGYLVLGKSIDPAKNGDVPVDIVYTSYTLSNGDDEIVLARPNGVVVDEVVYDDGVTFPDDAGRSISLRPDRLDATANDLGANWCHSTTPISGNNPDTGTPKALNDVCG